MATYKVLQDIEAEDKLLGPLTLKQFIFAGITIALGFIEFKLVNAPGLGLTRVPLMLLFFLPMLIFGFLASPIGRDQPNDIWLLARLRFLIKPHRRIWNQDGISQLVTITAPKRLEQIFTNNLSQTEVRSRLSALATTLDSRGWAIKNINVNLFGQPGYLSTDDGSDRLVAPSALPTAVSTTDVQAADDMLDASSNPVAQHLDQMVEASSQAHHQQLRDSLKPGALPAQPPQDYWFLNQPEEAVITPQGYATFQNSRVVTPGSVDTNAVEPTADEKALLQKIEAEQSKVHTSFGSHLKTIQPLSGSHPSGPAITLSTNPVVTPAAQQTTTQPLPPLPAQQNDQSTATKPQTATPNPAILELANNDDLNVATIARQAKRISDADDEVVISLH